MVAGTRTVAVTRLTTGAGIRYSSDRPLTVDARRWVRPRYYERRIRTHPDRISQAVPPAEHVSHSYDLHVHNRAVARLEWRGGACWHLEARSGAAESFGIDGIDGREVYALADDDAAALGLSLALDEAARRLLGAPPRPHRRAPGGVYELHVAGIAREPLPLVFPEASVAIAGDTAVISGRFDDAQLERMVRRVGLLGGRLLALLPAS